MLKVYIILCAWLVGSSKPISEIDEKTSFSFEPTALAIGRQEFSFLLRALYVKNKPKKVILCPVPGNRENLSQCVAPYGTAHWEWKIVTSTSKWKILSLWHLFSFTMFCLLDHLHILFSYTSSISFPSPRLSIWHKDGTKLPIHLCLLFRFMTVTYGHICCVVLSWLFIFCFELLYREAICLLIGKNPFVFFLPFKLFKSWVENKIVSGIYLLFPEASTSFIYYSGTENYHLETATFTKDTLIGFC